MDSSKKKMIQGIIMASAIAMTAYGVYRGEIAIVLNKAINICLECIGLG